jgi:alpha-L-rhamnosidase
MLAGRVVHTDFAHTGAFSCSNELLNAIQAATIASTIGNYHGMPTDCPHREKNGWTGDAQLSAEQVLYNFAAAAAYTKWLDDFPDVQRVSGALPGFLPSGGWGYNWGAGPAWDSAYIMIPWYLYLYRGDRDILRRHYAGMRKCLDFMASLATDHIVEFGLGDWCPPSPGPGSHKCPAALTNTAYYYADTRIVARIAELLGKRSDARRLTALAAKIKAAARRHFYDRKTGRVAGHSQTSLACFLFQGLVEPDEIPAFTQMLLDEVAAYNDHIDCGILGTKYVMNVLTETGHADVAYRIATQRDFPSWGHWLAQGATTLWENWDGAHSRNHHMFSDISAWFYKTLAGIVADPAHPGFKHIIIKPWPVGDLTHAEGSVMTPYGRVRSAWRRTPECFTLDVIVPPNSRATVYLPTTDAASVCESGRAVTSVDTVVYRGCIDGRAAFEFGAGTYCFTLACQPAACCNQFADSR